MSRYYTKNKAVLSFFFLNNLVMLFQLIVFITFRSTYPISTVYVGESIATVYLSLLQV